VAALSVALSAITAITAPVPAAAQGPADYPSKPIRYVVPFAPGGLTDIMARMVGHQLSEDWGKPIVIDNKPGGNANIGADQVAKAP
ncbi:tripartite tricarboxylate transporter substrate-binding protein, partial [Acinetobacter baumannii]